MVTLSLHAMATRFELVLYGNDPVRLRAAGEEALQEIERLEGQLSLYRRDSEISHINSHAAVTAVKVEPRLFRLLSRCALMSEKTGGAFDVTVGPLMRAWGFVGGSGHLPEPAELAAARRCTGMGHIIFDEGEYTVRFTRPGMQIDLGGYGKGYAVERAASILMENGVTSALLHGGTSSVFAVGAPPLGASWKVALSGAFAGGGRQMVVELNNSGLSVSAPHGKCFRVDGHTYGHVLDPRTAEPTQAAPSAAVVGPSPADCEALSKALLILGPEWLPAMAEAFPGFQGFLAPSPSAEVVPGKRQ
jgi:FAD:protein FMN transferase